MDHLLTAFTLRISTLRLRLDEARQSIEEGLAASAMNAFQGRSDRDPRGVLKNIAGCWKMEVLMGKSQENIGKIPYSSFSCLFWWLWYHYFLYYNLQLFDLWELMKFSGYAGDACS